MKNKNHSKPGSLRNFLRYPTLEEYEERKKLFFESQPPGGNPFVQTLEFLRTKYPICFYRPIIDKFGRKQYPEILPNDPIGPYQIPRITSFMSDSFSNLRFLCYPNGNDSIRETPDNLIPEWEAYAGFRGSRAGIRAYWGSPVAYRHFVETSSPPTIYCLDEFFISSKPAVFFNDCRSVLKVTELGETTFHDDDKGLFERDSNLFNKLILSRLVPGNNEPCDMFPDSAPTPYLKRFFGSCHRGVYEHFLRFSMIRCLFLFLSKNETVEPEDYWALILLCGLDKFLDYVEKAMNASKMMDEQLD